MSLTVENDRSMPRRSFALIVCYGAMMVVAAGVNLMPVLVMAMSGDFPGLSDEQRGRIGALTFTGAMLAFLVFGPLVDRLPGYAAKATAVAGNLLSALGLLLLAIAPSYPMVLAASFLMGIGAGTLDMILSPIISVLRPKHRTVALNLLHGFYCVGAVLTILVGSWVPRLGLSWRGTALCILPYPLLVGIAFLTARIPPLIAKGSVRTPLRMLCKDSFFLLTLAAMVLAGATELGFAYWLPTYGKASLHFSEHTAAMAFLGFNLAMGLGRLIVSLLGHKARTVDLLLGCCAACLVIYLTAAFAPPLVAIAAAVLAGLAAATLWPSALAMVSDRHPHGGASTFAILGAMGNAGGVAMPWIMGVIADHSSLSWAIATSALCPLLMMVVLLLIRRIGEGQKVSAPELTRIGP